MKKTKQLAWLMICILIVQIIPGNLFANSQNIVSRPDLTKPISHKKDSNNPDKISPIVEMAWAKPEPTPGLVNLEPGNPMKDTHYTTDYQMELYDYGSGKTHLSQYIKDNKPTDLTERMGTKLDELPFGFNRLGEPLNNYYFLENGSFYRSTVYGRHKHDIIQSDGTIKSDLAPDTSGSPSPIYFITDFDTKLNDTPEGLELEWEYIPGADYTVYYVAADKKTKGEILNKTEGTSNIPYTSVLVTDEMAKDNLVVGKDKSKVRYVLKDVKPKQIYSMFVEVTGFSTDPSGQGIDRIVKNTNLDETGPKVVQGIPGIDIDVYNVGKEEIEIYWGQISWAEIGGNLQGIRVYAREEGKEQHLVAEKSVSNSGNLISIILDEPANPTYYQVGFIIDGKEVMSREKLYVPLDLRLQPLNPKVPKPYGKNLDITNTKNEYLVTGDTIGLEDADFINHTFHAVVGEGTSIRLVWDAPRKQEDDQKQEIDYDLYYDIWVSDNLKMLQDNSKLDPLEENLQIRKGDLASLITKAADDSSVVGMRTTLTNYMDKSGKVQPIKSNNAYYIKIVAKRAYGNQYTKSQPTIVSINIDKNGNISVPPVIGKPPLRLQEDGVTKTSIAIEWRTAWHEVLTKNLALYDEDKDERTLAEIGSTKVYTPKTPTLTKPLIHFKFKEGWEEHILLTEDDVKEVKTSVTETAFAEDYYSRRVELEEDVKYEIKVLPYNEVEASLEKGQSIENWVATTQRDDVTNWNSINPTEGTQDDRGLIWKQYKVDDLQPNTRYVIMLRAYRITDDGSKLMQTFPSYIIATTLTDYEGPEPIPTVPNLQLESYTDTSISVYWKYNKDFEYELVYSTKDNPSTAKVWEFKISDDPTDKNYVPNGEKASVTIYGLFPQTTYNVWIRAKQKKGTEISHWSNPVTVKTKDIVAPDVPTGLGPAATQSLLDIGQDINPIGSDYITVEWTKDFNDKGTQIEGTISKAYEYDLEFADNVEFLDSQTVTIKDELGNGNSYDILAKNLVKFNKLIANRPYYVRIKARIILTDTESNRTISKESQYSTWVRIFTKTSGGEYDGGENENIITYPNAIEEDYNKGEWTLEIVDTGKIISQIKESHDYFYTISMKEYKNRYDAHLRRIKIPVSVMEALVTSRMELKVETQTGIYEIPAGAMAYYFAKASAKDIVQIELTEVLAYDLKDIAMPFPYFIQSAEKLSIGLRSKTVTKSPMERFDGRIKVAIKLDSNNSYQTNTLKTYTYDYNYGGWLHNEHKIDTRADATYAVYSTASTGLYTLQNIINYTDYRNTNAFMDELLSRFNIETLGTKYSKDKKVHSDQMINLLMGIAKGYVDIDLDATTSETRNKAKAAGFYIENGPGLVTQEQALHAVVRLYETKTGNRVKPSSVTFSGVSPKYKESVQKAYALGLINQVRPNETINYGQLASLIILVLP